VTALAFISQVLLLVLGVFLMIVVLLQRGRGGGLAGAFGGMGGQSAFGTKAGDVFTRITIVIAIIWVILAGGSGYLLRAAAEQRGKKFVPETPLVTAPDKDQESSGNNTSATTSGGGGSRTETAEPDGAAAEPSSEKPSGDKTPPAGDASSNPDAGAATGKPGSSTPPASSDQP
jgi:preprotein translocase subunit SecG